MVDQIRPNQPIPFIANFMLKNKYTMRNLEDLVKEVPKVDCEETLSMEDPVEEEEEVPMSEEGKEHTHNSENN